MDKIYKPHIAFLGICDKISHQKVGHPIGWNYNLIGLRQTIMSYIYPLNLKGYNFLFAVYNPREIKDSQIVMNNAEGVEVFKIDLRLDISNNNNQNQITSPELPKERIDFFIPNQEKSPCWVIFNYLIKDDIVINEPTNLQLFVNIVEEKISIGNLQMVYLEGPPFGTEFINQLKTNPLAYKFIKMIISCKSCHKQIEAYTGLERESKIENENVKWFQDLPARFICGCKKTDMDLKYVKNNLHVLLGMNKYKEGEILISKLYDSSVLNGIISQFKELINRKPKEEDIQKFFEQNPILLHFLSSDKVFFKKPILNNFITDICILNNKKELLLIEIERADLKLIKKDGGITSQMQHAMDQVRNWLHSAKEERSAVIKGIGLKPDEVSNIRGIVILGRNINYGEEKLRQLKGTNFGDLTLYTYDDILNSLLNLKRDFDGI